MLLNNLSVENLNKSDINLILNEIRAVKNINKNTTTVLLNILIKLCEDFKKCKPDIIFKVCLTICQEIVELTPKYQDKYLRIMYFAIQYLFENACYKEISILLDYVLPSWNPLSDMESTLEQTYGSLFLLVYNITSSCMKTNLKKDFNVVEELIIKTLIIHNIGKPNKASAISIIYQFVNSLDIWRLKMRMDVKKIYAVHLRILKFLTTEKIVLNSSDISLIYRFQMVSMSMFSISSSKNIDKLNEITLKFQNLLCTLKLTENVFITTLIRDLFLLFNDLTIENLTHLELSIKLCEKNADFKQLVNIFATLIQKSIIESQFDAVNISVVEKLFDFLLYIMEKLDVQNSNAQKLYGKCCLSCNCNLASYNYAFIGTTILKLGTNFRSVLNSNMWAQIRQSFEFLKKGIQLLKSNLCTHWESFLINTGTYYFNCLNSYTKKRDESFEPMVIHLSRVLFEYFNDDLRNRTSYLDIIKRTLYIIVAVNYDLGNWQKCLETLVLLAVLFNNDTKLPQLWVTCQANVDSITMVDILQNNIQSLRVYYPNFNLENTSFASIACFELRIYNNCGPLPNPMIKCCKFLLQNSECVFIKAQAFQMLWMIGIPLEDSLWSELNLFVEFLNAQLEAKESKTKTNWRLVLANLYFVKYMSLVKNVMQQKMTELFRSDNENTVCSTIKNEENDFKYIENAVSNWMQILDSSYDLSQEINDNHTLDIIHRVIIIYELHNHTYRSMQSILILYQMSKLAKNNIFRLRSLIYLLKYAFCPKLYSQLIDEGHQVLKMLDLDGNTDPARSNLELLFLLNQSYNLLMRGEYAECYKTLQNVQEKYNGIGVKNKVFEIQMDFLRINYLSLPCSVIGVDKEHGSLLTNAKECFDYVTRTMKEFSQRKEWSNELLIALHYFIEVSHWISILYLNLSQPRESRCYVKNIFKMLSFLNLPLRYTQILGIQCKLDLLCAKYDDCLIKFDKLLDALCIVKDKSVLHVEDNISNISKKMEKLNLVATQHQNDIDMLLDISMSVPKITFNKTISDDHFMFILSHSENCQCFLCTNYSYQLLCFESLLIYSHLKKNSTSVDNLLKDAEKSMQSVVDIIENTSSITIPSVESSLYKNIAFKQIQNIKISYYKYVLKICNELFLKCDYEKALNILNNALISLDNANFEIINEILCLICKIVKSKNLPPPPLQINIETPEKTKTKSVSICTPEKQSPMKRNALLFTTPSNRLNKFFKSHTPGLTPAPARFKIYTPKTERKPNRKALILTDVKPLNTENVNARSPSFQDVDRLYVPYKFTPDPKNAKLGKKENRTARKKILSAEINTKSSAVEDVEANIQISSDENIAVKLDKSSFSNGKKSEMDRSTPILKEKEVEKMNSEKIEQKLKNSRNKLIDSLNKSTDFSSAATDLDGDDDVFVSENNKVSLDTKIKKVVTKNKQVRNKSTVKLQTDHFSTTLISDCNDNSDNLAVSFDKCLKYKHTYSKSTVNNHLSEYFSKISIEKSETSDMTHTSTPSNKKIKLKKATKRIISNEEETVEKENDEVEPRRIYTRRAKKIESLELLASNDKSMEDKSPVEVPSPKLPKKITKTKKIVKPKQKTNSSPNPTESVPKPRKKAKNPFIL